MLSVQRQLRIPLNFCHWTAKRSMQITRAQLYEKCYRILGVNENADQNTVRQAYIDLVKMVHPDSGQPEASVERFQEVDEAFKLLQEKFAKNRRNIFEEEEETVFDIRHTAPQHRQYLNFDGVGFGNPFQRQKQHQQIKAMKAQERVMDHRIDKAQAGERTLMQKGGTYYKKHAIKTKYGLERVVEDLIQEAMSKGDFSNLTGEGKPLSSEQTQNPYLDFTTQKLNKIMLDNGFTPEWITLQRDIREAIKALKDDLKSERIFYGEYPLSAEQESQWQNTLKRFDKDVKEINKNIDKYNLIVPILQNQLFRLKLDKLAEQILKDPDLPKNFKRQQHDNQAPAYNSANSKPNDFLALLSSWF